MIAKAMIKVMLRKFGLLEICREFMTNHGFKYYARAKGLDCHILKNGVISISKKEGTNKKTINIAKKHAVYAGDMINYFEYYFNAVEPEIMGGGLL